MLCMYTGYGIINATGDLWRAQRKAGLKFFSGANLDALVEHVLPEVYNDMTKKQLSQAAKDGTVVDLQQIFHDLTTTVVGHMAYDMEISASSPFSRAFDHASSHIGLRFQNPLYRLTEVFSGSDFRDSLATVKQFGRQIVSNARRRRSRAAFESLITDDPIPEDAFGGTLIDSLIESLADPLVVADAALNFLSAGRDTTAQSLTWTLYALLRHRTALEDLRAEVTTKIPDVVENDAEAVLDVASLQPTNLPLTLATFYEALRLHPPVPFEIKQTATDKPPVTLPDGTYLPPGAVVVWCIHAFNRAREVFGDDSHLFRPRRWLDDDRSRSGHNFTPKSPFEFPVFNGGSRACLGKKMAEVMAVWVLVRICTEWEFDEVLADGYAATSNGNVQKEHVLLPDRVSANSLTLPMEGGLPCRVRVRKQSS
ncbi:hypothetical protein LTS17_002687 [Exophiala oligosperma]